MENGSPSDDVTTTLPEVAQGVVLARRLTRETLASWGFGSDVDDTVLLVSELVENALRHGRGAPVLRLRRLATGVRVEVFDESPVLPQARESGPSGGWGMLLVARLSTRWGAEERDGGKVVWCELPVQSTTLAGPATEGVATA
jgi:anti-sigma regulatory factor (Ser/Thr protein kinase)